MAVSTDPIQTLLDRIHKSVNWALRTAAGGQPDGWRHMDSDALVAHIASTLRAGLAPALHNYAVAIGTELRRGPEPAADRTAVAEETDDDLDCPHLWPDELQAKTRCLLGCGKTYGEWSK